MKILVSEFITGGGMVGENLPSSLQKEGEMMLSAIVTDLSKLSNIELLITRDKRCTYDNYPTNIEVQFIEKNYLHTYTELCKRVDTVLPIAPESEGILERLSQIVFDQNKLLLGSEPDVIKLMASKKATADLLTDHKIQIVETKYLEELDNYPESKNGWIVKPDQGVGSEQVIICKNKEDISLAASQCDQPIIQPYIKGISASLSMLCNNGESVIIGYNEQVIKQQNNRLNYVGSKVNSLMEYKDQFDQLASSVVKVLPTLRGYVGMDVIKNGDDFLVVEINPRLTTSYVALAESTYLNSAKMILELFEKNKLPNIDYSKFKIVTVGL